MHVKVVEIYPYPDKGKFIERGSVHVFIEDLGLDLKNIHYHVNEEKTKTDQRVHLNRKVRFRMFSYTIDKESL